MAVIKELRAEQRKRLQFAMDSYLYHQREAAKKGEAPEPMRVFAARHGVTLNAMRNLRKVMLEMQRQGEQQKEDAYYASVRAAEWPPDAA